MSYSGLKVLDSSLQKTNLWLDELADYLDLESRQKAYKALRAVLHTLRDVLSVEENAQLSAQLPLIIRGIYFEGWKPGGDVLHLRNKRTFLGYIYHHLHPGFNEVDIDTERVAKAVFLLLSRHISEGEIEDIKALLDKPIKDVWQEALLA